MDPFDYDVDPVSQSLLDKGSMNLPVTTGPSSVSSLSGGGGMDPATGAMLAKFGVDFLGGLFSGRRRRKEEEARRKLEQEQLAIQRGRLNLEKQRYGDEMARMRARSDYMKPIMESYRSGSGSFAPTQRPQTALRGYMVGRQEDERA